MREPGGSALREIRGQEIRGQTVLSPLSQRKTDLSEFPFREQLPKISCATTIPAPTDCKGFNPGVFPGFPFRERAATFSARVRQLQPADTEALKPLQANCSTWNILLAPQNSKPPGYRAKDAREPGAPGLDNWHGRPFRSAMQYDWKRRSGGRFS